MNSCEIEIAVARHFNSRINLIVPNISEIFMAGIRIILDSNPHFWCVENPVGKMKKFLGKPKLYFNPCDYGDPYTKKTCLWGNFNIPKKNPVKPTEGSKTRRYPPSKNRAILRSITPPSFAKAFFEANR